MESKGLRVGELARRTGLTVRTLHHWEAVGLLVPEGRTPSGHRLYGGEAVQRLQSIRSLKVLGLGLEEIRTVLSSGAASLEDAIRAQHQHVKEQLRKLEALEERLQKTLSFLRDGGEAPQEELMRNMEMMTAIQVHFSSKELAFLRTRGDSLEAETIREAQEEWPELIQSMKAEMAKGTDPSNAVVKKLASRWRGLVQAFSGGNERVEGSLSSMYRSEPGLAEGQGFSEELFQYVARALSELKHDAQDGAA